MTSLYTVSNHFLFQKKKIFGTKIAQQSDLIYCKLVTFLQMIAVFFSLQ